MDDLMGRLARNQGHALSPGRLDPGVNNSRLRQTLP
jgi:hypothetical protein